MEGDHKGRPYRDRHAVGAPLVGALLNVIADDNSILTGQLVGWVELFAKPTPLMEQGVMGIACAPTILRA